MTVDVCMVGNTLSYVEGSGQLWIHLNWALSLLDAGVDLTWVEFVEDDAEPADTTARVDALTRRLEVFGLADRLRLASNLALPPGPAAARAIRREEFAEADLMLSFCYWFPSEWVKAARAAAIVDIDPGLLQIWMADGDMVVAPHDHYFTIGETVGTPEARFPDGGVDWTYTPPPVHLPSWPVVAAPMSGAYTTVSHWWEDGWVCFDGEEYQNDKRVSFLDFVEVPKLAGVPVELATNLTDGDADDRVLLEANAWRLRDSASVSRTPTDYRHYIQESRGEFSCAKPSCMKLQNAWVSDRTICYLATGRPAIVQHTGPSRVLPDAAGILRFTSPAEAAAALQRAEADYDFHAREARALAEHTFDGNIVVRSILERCL
ncbi:MAG: hypothetical protein JWL83_1287 [Actinomycetia bacterium]|nr:hypothetical protein [Actinomycetes bacterium]